ncbi:MAG: glycogen debranching protein GlgX [Rhodobacteraceae bacterium]|nr:glycogen debranching protein GlgX [Paracoccaceae bacterium]
MPVWTMTEGRPHPMGATLAGDGVNFAVFSAHADRIQLCLFSDDGTQEVQRLDLPERDGDIWYGFVPGLAEGQLYGLRVHGSFCPAEGHRFNPAKLLLDPYARRITGHPRWHGALIGGDPACPDRACGRDSADFMPRCVVTAPNRADLGPRPSVPRSDMVIYEAHPGGLTRQHPEAASAGRFAALASDAMLAHYRDLGITSLELLPVQAFINDRFLIEKGLVNYWGYQTIGFFAPEPRYLATDDIDEFRSMARRLHLAGIELILDVVYNHTGEGDASGPTLSFRGLDNASYYRLEAADARAYVNDTGTGNTLAADHPMVLRMILDSLRYWVTEMGVDGFRFDLCTTLGRLAQGFDPDAPFFQAIRQDPVLAGTRLIAEPWDIGPGGYQLGAFPAPFHEWNDRFRDDVRRFWRGDAGMAPALANRITGSAHEFDHSGRRATTSVNMLTAHDGFTLADVVSYATRHNAANGEDNRDGHAENHSDNMGVEGPTEDRAILSARARRCRNLMATLMLSQGTPMLLAGDEMGNSQQGNNNAYAQDNPTGWIDWSGRDGAMHRFTRALIGFRAAHPILRQTRFLHAHEREDDGFADLFWWSADGSAMTAAQWNDPDLRLLCAEVRTAAATPEYASREDALYLVFNAGEAQRLVMPAVPEGRVWRRWVDTHDATVAAGPVEAATTLIAAASVVAFVLEAPQ